MPTTSIHHLIPFLSNIYTLFDGRMSARQLPMNYCCLSNESHPYRTRSHQTWTTWRIIDTTVVIFKKRSFALYVGIVLDINLAPRLTTIVTQVSDAIQNCKKIITSGAHQVPYDVPFGKQCRRRLADWKDRNILSLMIRVDGISLVKSYKLKLWLCSSSIIEIPHHLPTQRQKILLLFILIEHTESVVKLWLPSNWNTMQKLKKSDR